MKKRFTEEEIEFLRKNYFTVGIKGCAAFLGRSLGSIKQKAKELNLRIYNSLPKINTEKFDRINDPEVAYFLGLMWADGYCGDRTVSIEMVQDDLLEVKPVFDYLGKWYEYPIQTTNKMTGQEEKPRIKLGRFNADFANRLAEFGMREKSNGISQTVISSIPKRLHHYFWRGFLDGDGCIFLRPKGGITVTFSGPIGFEWFHLENLLIKLKIVFSVDRIESTNGDYSRVVVNNRTGCKSLLDYIYKDADRDQIGLSRKFSKYKKELTCI